MTNRPDLIAQLEKLTPTEGEWIAELQKDNIYYLLNEDTELMLLDKDWCMKAEDNSKLITLAPTMRLEILAMAKEIEELKDELKEWKLIEDGYKHDNTSSREMKKP